MNIQQVRKEKITTLPENIWEVYNSSLLGRKITTLSAELNLSKEKEDVLTNIIGDAILNIHKTNNIPQKLQSELGVGADTAQRIFTDMKELLSPVIQREQAALDPNRDGIKELEQNFKSLREEAIKGSETAAPEETPENLPTANDVDDLSNDVQTDPARVPRSVNKTSYTVEPLHTMETDVTRIHGYGAYRDMFPDQAGEQSHKEETIKTASQEEILTKKPELTEKPNYSE